jgi:hypothetical protein
MSKERPRNVQLEPEAVLAYAQTFVNRRDMYPIQLGNGAYASVKKTLTESLIYAHLRGHITLGTYALDRSGWAKWLCFDADTDERWHGILDMARTLTTIGVTPYLEPSRRGGHLWLFTDPIPGFQIRRFGRELLTEHELSGVEIYPKQDKPTTGPGSLVRLPLGIHRLTGKRYHFVNLEGKAIAPTIREQIKIFADPAKVDTVLINRILERAPQAKQLSPTPHFETVKRQSGGLLSEQIKAAIPVYEFVRKYVELDSQGKGYCPFHDDEHKSFQISQEGNFWNCYAGCGGGSIIDFWMKWREKHGKSGDFKSTIRDLAKMLL